ncbi:MULTISPECIES: DUF983 domain-containing protein [unclassified Polaribacter]|uniref:DUF983 domain-containing protein n=1 Tax=unclassified Polaribacter TaxID=196858 RepID=UPI0011BF3708|nr:MULTISPECIES: DUF983 domain-containing protein [unclassified Polaribacter]TXD53223.1 DUF983 domain-containing protein [Polaribacter sp. IC063]TXD61370.1 DUF983 domain-containing protein [Polaribacter sp. IC066]
MFKKGTKLYSIANGKCPKCHEGVFFANSFTFNPSKVTKIHSHCSKCNLKYMLEPSFFYGAMYVNYGITVAISITVFVITKLGLHLNLLESFLSVLAALLILAPVNLRLARIIWINMFVSFDKNASLTKNV